MKQVLEYLYQQGRLSKSEAKKAMIDIAEGKTNNSQIAAFLSVFKLRDVSIDEFYSFGRQE